VFASWATTSRRRSRRSTGSRVYASVDEIRANEQTIVLLPDKKIGHLASSCRRAWCGARRELAKRARLIETLPRDSTRR